MNGSDDSDVYSEVEEHVDVEYEGSGREAPILSPADLRVHERLQGGADKNVQLLNGKNRKLDIPSDKSAFKKDSNLLSAQDSKCDSCTQNNSARFSTSAHKEGTRPAARPSFLITDILSSSSRDRTRDSSSSSSVANTPSTPCTPATIIDIQKTAALLAQRQTGNTSLAGISPTGSCDSPDSDGDDGELSFFYPFFFFFVKSCFFSPSSTYLFTTIICRYSFCTFVHMWCCFI